MALTTAPSPDRSRTATVLEQMRTKQEVLPEKALSERGAAGGLKTPADKRLSKHPMNKPKRARPKSAPKPKRSPY